jgi:hypothetical protein
MHQQQHFKLLVKQLDDGCRSGGIGMFFGERY